MMVAETRSNGTHSNERQSHDRATHKQPQHPHQRAPRTTGEEYIWNGHYGWKNYGPIRGMGWQNRTPLSNGAMTTISEIGKEITLVVHGRRKITARIGDKFGIGNAIFRIVSHQTRSGSDRHGTISKPMVESEQIGGGKPPADYESIMVGNRLRLCAETVAHYHPSRTYRH